MSQNVTTDCVLLGLLSHQPMTGYDLKKRIEAPLRLFWNASYGSIYPALNRLKTNGYITGNAATDTGREKITYVITEKGRSMLREWLADPAEKNELRFELLLKVFFGDDVGPDITQQRIAAFEDDAKAQLPYLDACIAKLAADSSEPAHLYYRLTALFGKKMYQAYVDWCEEAQQLLKKQGS